MQKSNVAIGDTIAMDKFSGEIKKLKEGKSIDGQIVKIEINPAVKGKPKIGKVTLFHKNGSKGTYALPEKML